MSEPVSLAFALIGYAAVNAATRSGTAVSPEASAVRDRACAIVESTERSIALFGPKAGGISEMWSPVADHAHIGWDGNDARPISRLAGNIAEAFIRALPNDVPTPEFAAEPDGSISLDWIDSRTRLVSVS